MGRMQVNNLTKPIIKVILIIDMMNWVGSVRLCSSHWRSTYFSFAKVSDRYQQVRHRKELVKEADLPTRLTKTVAAMRIAV